MMRGTDLPFSVHESKGAAKSRRSAIAAGCRPVMMNLSITLIQACPAGVHLLIEDVLKALAFLMGGFPLLGDCRMRSEILLIECHKVMYG